MRKVDSEECQLRAHYLCTGKTMIGFNQECGYTCHNLRILQ